jgi:hypothetical protein
VLVKVLVQVLRVNARDLLVVAVEVADVAVVVVLEVAQEQTYVEQMDGPTHLQYADMQ